MQISDWEKHFAFHSRACEMPSVSLQLIRTTKTATGLQVRATLMEGDFPKGIKIPDRVMANLNIIPHQVLPAWNYTIAPGASTM